MLIERIYDTDLAQASYLIGCQSSGEAMVVDPRRDVSVAVEAARRNGMRIVAVTETHIHADYLSGTRELAAATGAAAYVSAEGGADWAYGFDAERLQDGDRLTIGNLVFEAVHTPGHTPEHLSFLVTDCATTDRPGYLFSGDFVFAGDLGRPDLLDEVVGGEDTRFEGARQMYASLRDRFLTLPDYVQVLPGHGSGSACGKALGAVPSTTVGYERVTSWWGPLVESGDEAAFVEQLLAGQPDAPAYFARMKRQNRGGPAVLGERAPMAELSAGDVASGLADASLVVVDPRTQHDVHEGTVRGALNVPAAQIATYGAWVVDPETDDRAVVLLAPDRESAERMRDGLARVGVDRVLGYVRGLDGLPIEVPTVVTSAELDGVESSVVLDVRARSEHEAGAIPGSELLQGNRVLWNLDRIPAEGTVLAYCRSGVRSSVVAGMLRNHGYRTAELAGGYTAWAAERARREDPAAATG